VKVLLTGAGGFVGSHVATELLARGHEVRAVRRPGKPSEAFAGIAHRVESVELDLFAADAARLDALARGGDLCIHLAWYAVPGKYLAAAENVECVSGSLRLLRALARNGCRRAVFVGSCFEYEFLPEPLREDGPVQPQSLYAASKLATRLMGEPLARIDGIEFAWARLFYLFGPFEDRRRLVPYVIDTLLRGEPVEVTQGTQVRDFLHVADVASALVAIALSKATGVVNVGSARPVTVRQVVSTLDSLIGRPGLVRFGARPDNPTDPPHVSADNRKLVEATGWSPAHDLESGLKHTIEWSRAHLVAR
jgi:nucleoside-diphosphate-sugar epimerase